MERKTDMSITRSRPIFSIVLILFVLGVAVVAGAANSLQKSPEYQTAGAHNQSEDAMLSDIKHRCDADLGPSYSLKVQKTYDGGYLFICSQVGDENGKETPHPQLVQEDRHFYTALIAMNLTECDNIWRK